MANRNKSHRRARVAVLMVLCSAVFAAFFARLAWMQFVMADHYADKAAEASSASYTVTQHAARGPILDAGGVVLARDATVYDIYLRIPAPPGTDLRKTVQTIEELTGSKDVETQLAAFFAAASAGELAVARNADSALLTALYRAGLVQSGAVRPAARGVRSWPDGALLPHALGFTGPLTAEQWPAARQRGLAMDAVIGQSGLEAAYDTLLRGQDGRLLVNTGFDGTVRRTVQLREARPGAALVLTVDSTLQKVLQNALLGQINTLRTTRAAGAGRECRAGAAVVVDVRTGGILAAASLPDFDLSRYRSDYAALSADSTAPLLDRVCQGLYAPGSAFKLVTATAALEEGVLTPETKILDTGRYTYYKSPQPQCWLYRQAGKTHGLETVTDAIADSCNIFFFDAGRRVGIETLGTYAKALGLGEKTGIELAGEQAGVVAGPAYTASVGGTWYEGSVLSAAIGQENHRFTPVQLAHMTATLVSGGERRQVHLLKQVAGEEAQEAVSLGKIALSEKNLTAIKEGMRRVVQSGSLAEAFRDLPVTAGAKTGSAQVAGEEESNAVLVCFAPYDAPKIALALVAEQGGSGAALGDAAAAILNAWAAGNLS